MVAIEISTSTILLVIYALSFLYVFAHTLLVNTKSSILSKIFWMILTAIFGIFGALAYFFVGSNEYYKLSKVK